MTDPTTPDPDPTPPPPRTQLCRLDSFVQQRHGGGVFHSAHVCGVLRDRHLPLRHRYLGSV